MIENFSILNEEKIELLERFYNLHISSGFNLTAIKEKDEFYLKHYADGLYIFEQTKLEFKTLADIGSGGGFPGIPIAIAFPEREITLIESIGKKCKFLENCAKDLGLKNVNVLNCRAEDINDRKFDIITARGVSEMKIMLKITAGMRDEKTLMLFYKGSKIEDEILKSKGQMKKKKLEYANVRIEEPFKRTYTFVGSYDVISSVRMQG